MQPILTMIQRAFLSGLAGLMLAVAPAGRAFTNYGILINPDYNIDSPVFVNEIGAQFLVYNLLQNPYRTFNTLAYTNRGLMEANVGFTFDTYSTATKTVRWASAFHNASGAEVNSGVLSGRFILGLVAEFARCVIQATNVVNRGQLSVAPEGILSLRGRNLDLSRGRMSVAAFEYSPLTNYPFGWFDGYWGLGTNEFNPATRFGAFFGTTPEHWVTNRTYLRYQTVLFGEPYVSVIENPAQSNRVINVAFLSNFDPVFTLNAYAVGRNMAVEWSWPQPDPITGTNATRYLYLFDRMGTETNLVLVTNGVAPPSTGYRATYIPTNFAFFSSAAPLGLGLPMAAGSTLGLFPSTNLNADFAAYELQFHPTVSLPGDVAGRTFTNMPGRLELIAEGPNSSLNLERARIYGLNSLVVKATNHFAGSGAAKIVTAYADLELGSTNSGLVISNLLAPVVPRLEGSIRLWSTRFDSVDAANFTNQYHVLFVDSGLAPTIEPRLQNLSLHGENLFIHDVLNVQSNLTLRARNVTIATNDPAQANCAGELNLLSGAIFWPDSTPGVRTLTNYGGISGLNLMYFNGVSNGVYVPYDAFVNYGTVANAGSFLSAGYFENRGGQTDCLRSQPFGVYATIGPVDLSAGRAELRDSTIQSAGSDVNLRASQLVVSNHVLAAGGRLTLQATERLDDGSLDGDVFAMAGGWNQWAAGTGLSLPVKPTRGSLLGTTVTLQAAPDVEVQVTWAAENRGKALEGFADNAALGQLILDGQWGSDFSFAGAGTNNALYVDRLVLTNAAAAIDASGDYPALLVAPNLTLYYAEALANGESVAERMNGRNGGRLQWVSAFAGLFSSTNVVYPDGTTNRLNRPLVASCHLDSDNDGVPNCVDPSPVFVPARYQFAARLTNAPAPGLLLTWQTLARSTNAVYATTNLAAPNWQRVTNFVFGPVNGTASYFAPLGAPQRYFRVRVDAPQP